jgi:hypothetical protein
MHSDYHYRLAPEAGSQSISTYIFRALIAVNAIRFALSFAPKFEGTANSPGWIDNVLGAHRLGGFRIDFLWIVLSTILIFFAGFHFLVRRRTVDALLCFLWTLAFFVFIHHLILIGVLDFG